MFREEEARALLIEMQARLGEGPHAALGVPGHASASDIRQAFLQLTKTFHPARFARLAPDIQRLANEVFLSLKSSHEQLAKPKPTAAGRPSSPSVAPATQRPPTRPFGVPTVPQRPTPPAGQPNRTTPAAMPAQQPGKTAPLPVQRFTPNNVGTNPGTTPPASSLRAPGLPSRPSSPSTAPINRPAGDRTPAPARQTPPGGVKFISPSPSTPPRPTNPTPGQQVVTPARSSSTAQVLDPQLAPVLELIARGQWDQAQRMIDALATRNPQSRRYQAMGSYCRGRRAQLEGNLGEARVELNAALLADPELDIAKTALNELFGRRK